MRTPHLTTQPGQLAFILKHSELFVRYREAFRITVGPKLHLVSNRELPDGSYPPLPLPSVTLTVPVVANGRETCYLRTDPFRLDDGKESFALGARRMLDRGCTATELRSAHRWFSELTVVTPERSQSAEEMLQMFAMQLGDFAEKVFLQTAGDQRGEGGRGDILDQSIQWIFSRNTPEPAGLSFFRFCRIFKQATGLTLTRLVNQARIDVAKRLLIRPQSRVTEVAYDVGYRSLSQFNRSFRRLTGLSPTEYRLAAHQSSITRSL